MCSAADDPTQHDAMSIDVEALVTDIIKDGISRGRSDSEIARDILARLVPAEDEGLLPCTCRPFFDGHVTGHPDCPRGRAEAEDEGRLREALDDLFRYDREHPATGGIGTRIAAVRAALAATPEPRP
jgi:hypothetical protein